MKRLILLLAIISPQAHASASLAGVVLAHTIDYHQTLDIIAKRDKGYYEANPLIGKRPTKLQVKTYFITTGMAYLMLRHKIKRKKRLDVLMLILLGGNVIRNNKIGLRVKF